MKGNAKQRYNPNKLRRVSTETGRDAHISLHAVRARRARYYSGTNPIVDCCEVQF